jgi:hypothetical protein
MDETRLRAEVCTLADSLSLLWHYCRDSRVCTGPDGLTDLVIAGRRGHLFAELKAGGTLSEGQRAWRDALLASGAPWRLWQPADWITGRIRAELESIA